MGNSTPSKRGRQSAPSTTAPGGDKPEDRFPLITCAALDKGDFTPRPIITDVLYAGSPAFVGGPFKTMKTLISVDMAVSIATGKAFLNHFTAVEHREVVYFSGEGGPSVIQEYGRRVASSKGVRLADVSDLHFCFRIPQLESLPDLDEVQRVHDSTAAEVMVFDNLMLALSGDNAGNVFCMGQILGRVNRICSERGITPIYNHHFKRFRSNGDPKARYAPGDLTDLTQAGAAENAGQWLLLTRRRDYDANNPGEHLLWLNIGGRLGHGCLHVLEVHEGRLSDPGGRCWEVNVRSPDEVQTAATAATEQQTSAKRAEKNAKQLESDRNALVRIATKLKHSFTKTDVRDRVDLGNGHRFNRPWESLVDDGVFEPTGEKKGKGPLFIVRSTAQEN
jgi:hypothetical protein